MQSGRSFAGICHCATEVALPARRRVSRRLPLAEVEDRRVCVPASVSTLSVLIVLPRDVQPAGNAHERRRAVRPALLAGSLVLRRIPGVRDLLCVDGDRNAQVVALWRRHHAPAPVLRDDRHPVAGEIDRRGGFRRRRRRRVAALGADASGGGQRQERRRRCSATESLGSRRRTTPLMTFPALRRARCRRPRRTCRSSTDRSRRRTGCGTPASDSRL